MLSTTKAKIELLKTCVSTLDKDSILSGIFFDSENAVSTDGIRIFVCKKPIEINGIYTTDLTSTIKGKYPEYEHLIPKQDKAKASWSLVLHDKELKELIAVLKAMPTGKNKAIKIKYDTVSINFSSKNNNSDLQVTASIDVPCTIENCINTPDDINTTYINKDFLIEALQACLISKLNKEDLLAKWDFQFFYYGTLNPLIIEIGVQKDDTLERVGTYLIMPIQTNG